MPNEDRRRLDDSVIHATIVRQEEPSEDDSSIYSIFERINSGGVRLKPQEIRNAVYHGAFTSLLHELNADEHWRAIYGPLAKDRKDEELILRFLALFYSADKYSSPMKEFLNRFMGRNRALSNITGTEFASRFKEALSPIFNTMGSKAFRPVRALNAAVFDSVMVALARRLESGPIKNAEGVRERYTALFGNQRYQAATSSSTADEANVRDRLSIATALFADIK